MNTDLFDFDPERKLWTPGRRSFLFLGASAAVGIMLPKPKALASIEEVKHFARTGEMLKVRFTTGPGELTYFSAEGDPDWGLSGSRRVEEYEIATPWRGGNTWRGDRDGIIEDREPLKPYQQGKLYDPTKPTSRDNYGKAWERRGPCAGGPGEGDSYWNCTSHKDGEHDER
jgi:hypothetical protein